MSRVSKCKSGPNEDYLKKLEVEMRNKIILICRQRQARHKVMREAVNTFYEEALLRIPPNILDKLMSSLTQEDVEKIEQVMLNANFGRKSCAIGATGTKRTTRTRMVPHHTKLDELRTPANQQLTPSLGLVTPKFNPYAPVSVLRVPKDGEMAMSMAGSPLHITAVINESKPNVVVPLHDGRVMSVLPERGLSLSQIPEINEDMRGQLQVLSDNLITLLSKSAER